MNLPPIPDGMMLLIEDSPESVRIEWPVPGGEWKRKAMLVYMAIGVAFPPTAFVTTPWAFFKLGITPTFRSVPVSLFLPQLSFFLLLFLWFCFIWLLPIARLTGNGEVVLERDLLRLHRGGGKQPLKAKRPAIASFGREGEAGIRMHFRKGGRFAFLKLLIGSGVGLYFYERGYLMKLPGSREADWTLEVLKGWFATSP